MDYEQLIGATKDSLEVALGGGVMGVADAIAYAHVIATMAVADRLNEQVVLTQKLVDGMQR